MNPITLFTSFNGRIGRIAFWTGLILIAAVSPFSIGTVLSDNPFTDAIRAVHQFGFKGFAWSLALLFSVAAILTKRLHDRGKSGLHAVIFYLPAAMAALTYFGGSGFPMLAEAVNWSSWIAWFAGATGIWFLISLGLYPGEHGPNKYGADPQGT